MLLSEYPRPADDTGLAIHTSPDWQDRYELGVLPELWEMGIRWFNLLVGNDEPATHGDIRRIRNAGFETILRLQPSDHITGRGKYWTNDEPPCTFPGDFLRMFVDVGVRYLRTGNEPQLAIEWTNTEGALSCYPDRLVELWDSVIDFELRNAENIRRAGGIPVLTDMGSYPDHNHLITYPQYWGRMRDRGVLAELYEPPVAQGIHNRPLNRPPNYPHDRSESFRDWPHPMGEWVNDRAYCFNEIEMVLEIAHHFGLAPMPFFATEAGYEWDWFQDDRYPRIDGPQMHGEMNLALARYFQERNIPELFALCYWHLHRRAPEAFYENGWFDNVKFGLRRMPVVQMFKDANFPAVRDALFAQPDPEPIPPALPDWIVDLRAEAVEHTGRTITRHIGTLVHHTGNPDAPIENQIDYVKTHACYHFLIDQKGTPYYMRDISEVVWHAGDGPEGVWNSGGVAVTFVGSFMGYAPSDYAFATFRRLRQWLIDVMGIFPTVKGHKDIRLTTACPGDWYPDLRYKLLEEGGQSELDRLRKHIKELETLLIEKDALMGRQHDSIAAVIEAVAEWR